MGDPTTDFVAMLDLEPHGPDVWVGTGPRYPWGGLYGGQIVAQALRAAAHTVEPQYRIHSLHAYFIRRGDHTEPVRYEVDRVRNGASFVTRRVVARQSYGAILTLEASFHAPEDGPAVQTVRAPDGVPDPDELPEDGWGWMLERRNVPEVHGSGRVLTWVRVDASVGEDAVMQQCALALASDTSAVAAVRARVLRTRPRRTQPMAVIESE